MTDLAQHIHATRLADTHEHLRAESEYVTSGPDVLQDLFGNYVPADLVCAGATEAAVKRLTDPSDSDVAGRLRAIQEAWERCKHTGFGEAVQLIAKHAYGMDEITPANVEAAQSRNEQLRRPGERLRILQNDGHLDHVQIDHFSWRCLPDTAGPDFFLYDLSWLSFCSGRVDPAAIHEEVGIVVQDLASLNAAMTAIFAKHAPCAVATKSQHAYERTLSWRERDAADVERVLQKALRAARANGKPESRGDGLTEEERLCLGDWCWARGVELTTKYHRPFKIHTGYYAGNGRMPVDWIRGGNLCALLAKYPYARFVLMHIAYPYNDELVALAKHYPNVYVDLCWAWSIDPYSACDFLRRMIHAVPSHKLFAFGGDTIWPNAAVAYARQARQWLTRALQAEVDEGLLTEREAMTLATRFMRTNQEECFDLAGTRGAIAGRTGVDA